MSYLFDSRLGEQLYQSLPELYRSSDKSSADNKQDLAKYLDAHGHLLDLIHTTLEQQLRDTLPATSQDWLLPYFAQLLAVNIVSPDSAGKHAEVDRAISWRQRKGTIQCAEEIAEAIGQVEVVIHEGWKRVAMTPRIGMPVMPVNAWDNTLNLQVKFPSQASQHPALPAAMLDIRKASRAVESLATNPATDVSKFAGIKQNWRQANFHGAPCFPDAYDDVSRRTVDMRTAVNGKGYFHHKRLLAFAPPAGGIFPLPVIKIKWSERNKLRYDFLIEEKEVKGVWVIRNLSDRIIEITDKPSLNKVQPYLIEGINFSKKIELKQGASLELKSVEAVAVKIVTFSTDTPVLLANDCLFGELSVSGLVQLTNCTLLDTAYLTAIQALNCIFMNISGKDITGSIAYSRIPEDAPISRDNKKMSIKSHRLKSNGTGEYILSTLDPEFLSAVNSLTAKAVLGPNTPEEIYSGADDENEMGYFNKGRINKAVVVKGVSTLSLNANDGYPLSDIIFENDLTINSGRLQLIRCAVEDLNVETELNGDGYVIESLSAKDSLFKNIQVLQGLVRLEYCTVMESTMCKHIQASDCIFNGSITGVEKPSVVTSLKPFLNCIRYSTIADNFLNNIVDKPEDNLYKKIARALQLIDNEGRLRLRTNNVKIPAFDKYLNCEDVPVDGRIMLRESNFPEYGCGVLTHYSADEIRFGAQDGGEIGAYHHKYYVLKAEAMLEKMREFLPVGIEPVLIFDNALLRVPIENKN